VTGLSVVAILVLGACNTTGSKTSGPERAVIAKAEQICLDTQDKVGSKLGDDPAADRDAIRAATDELMAIKAPTQNQNAWTLFVQTTNNLWIALDDVSQSLDPSVNDKARADRARQQVTRQNDLVKKYASDYHMTECARGYGR
jgi:hypothetical protein